MEIIGFVLPEVHGIRLFIDFALEDFVAVLVVSERFFLLFVANSDRFVDQKASLPKIGKRDCH